MTLDYLKEVIKKKPLHPTQTVVQRLNKRLSDGKTVQFLAEPANYRIITNARKAMFLSSWVEVEDVAGLVSSGTPPKITPPESKTAKPKGRVTKARKEALLAAIEAGDDIEYAELLAVAKSLKIKGPNQKPKPELIELVKAELI